MPLTYTNSLRALGFPAFSQAFNWTNDPNEDQAFLDFCVEVLEGNWGQGYTISDIYRNLVMDRSGVDPTVRWDHWEDGVFVEAKSRVIGTAQAYWADTNSKRDLGVGPRDMNIYWECDVRGRALSIDDLVVP